MPEFLTLTDAVELALLMERGWDCWPTRLFWQAAHNMDSQETSRG